MKPCGGEQDWRFINRCSIKEQRNIVKRMLRDARSEYYATIIHECGNDQRRLFETVKNLLQPESMVSGNTTTPKFTPDDFNAFFMDKV